jgi:hypothetical protein
MQSFSRLRVATAIGFNDETKLGRLSCLQLSQTGIFFTWKAPLPGMAGSADLLPEETDELYDGQWSVLE